MHLGLARSERRGHSLRGIKIIGLGGFLQPGCGDRQREGRLDLVGRFGHGAPEARRRGGHRAPWRWRRLGRAPLQDDAFSRHLVDTRGEFAVLPFRHSGLALEVQGCVQPRRRPRDTGRESRRPGAPGLPHRPRRRQRHRPLEERHVPLRGAHALPGALRCAERRRRAARLRHLQLDGRSPRRRALRCVRGARACAAPRLPELLLGCGDHELARHVGGHGFLGHRLAGALEPHEYFADHHPDSGRLHLLSPGAHRQGALRHIPRLDRADEHVPCDRNLDPERVCRCEVRRAVGRGAGVHGGHIRGAPRAVRARLVHVAERGLQRCHRPLGRMGRPRALQLRLVVADASRRDQGVDEALPARR
mmetsp:Transcript_31346/g.91444  ORF Transcript_31346/g.91444 Transcript_31346/m.91444 type:complete len:362 (-) Transcript_31346:626-1711(-)